MESHKNHLITTDSTSFEALLLAVENATSNSLFQPDWEANRVCVQGMNTIRTSEMAQEIGDIIRTKINATESRVILLTLHLIDSFVNECGQKWHIVMNQRGFCDDIVAVARKYWGRGGSENIAVVDACSDLILSWGEAFLPHRKQYPNIVEMYLGLRQLNFPFSKSHHHHHHEPQHVPGFTQQDNINSNKSNKQHHHRNTDSIDADAALAASLQASLNLETARERSRDSPALDNNGALRGYDSPARLGDMGARSRQTSVGNRQFVDSPSLRSATVNDNNSVSSTPSTRSHRPSNTQATLPGANAGAPESPLELIEALRSATNLLRDLIGAAGSTEELRRNELAKDIAGQIQTNQSKINVAVERFMNDGELVERLFRVNDDSQSLFIVYQEINNGSISLAAGKQKLKIGSRATSPRMEGIAVSSRDGSHRASPVTQRVTHQQQGAPMPPPNHHQPHQQQTQRQPPPPHSPNTTRKKGPRKDSLEGDLTVITAEVDPFAPQAIDALFDTKPTAASTNHSHKSTSHPPTTTTTTTGSSKTSPTSHVQAQTQHHGQVQQQQQQHVPASVLAAAGVVVPAGHPPPPADIPAKALKNIDSDLTSLDGTVIAAAEDPFAPEALDALFTKKSQTQPYNYHQPIPHALNHQHQHQQPHYGPPGAVAQPIQRSAQPPNMPGVHPQAQYYAPIQQQQGYPLAAVPAMPLQIQVPYNYPTAQPPQHQQQQQQQSRSHHPPGSNNGSPSQQQQQHQQQQQQQQHQQGNGFDPFSPAALDALFTGSAKPVASQPPPHHPHSHHHHAAATAGAQPPGHGAAHHRVAHLQQEESSHHGSRNASGRNSPARLGGAGAAMSTEPPYPYAVPHGNGVPIAAVPQRSPAHPSHAPSTSNKVDPFSPDALDAMLGLTPGKPQQGGVMHHPPHHAHTGNNNNNSRPNSRPSSRPTSRSHSPRTTERDPFSPQALDALFDGPTPTASTKSNQSHGHHHNQQHQHHVPHGVPGTHSPQISPHGNNNVPGGYFPAINMPPPGMMYVAGPNGMIYAAPANIPPPPGYYPIQPGYPYPQPPPPQQQHHQQQQPLTSPNNHHPSSSQT